MKTNNKRKVLIITGRYLPGYKDGGPVRSIKNLTDYLGDEYDFKILTCDRDHGDTKPYPNIKVFDWNKVGKAWVYYVPPGKFSQKIIFNLSNQVDVIYVCGCSNDYSINTLILKRLGKIKIPVFIAAMGLFSPLEFRRKYIKKKTYITLCNILGLFKDINWSATSEMEINEIKQQVWAKDEQFFIAEDLPRMVELSLIEKKKDIGKLEVVWISRIAPKKNLLYAISILKEVDSKVNFCIYGPIHDNEYWNKCKKELQLLPDNISWKYKGMVESESVVDTLRNYHVFLFPTLGENYGHVIQEALSAGCACIISDQTPWQDLEQKGVGYSFPLSEKKRFVDTINYYAGLSEFNTISNKATQYAAENSNKKVQTTGYRRIFEV